MIAENEGVQSDPVEQIDHMRALIEGRRQRGRNGVAAMGDEHRPALRAFRGDDGGELRKPADGVDRFDAVEIVHMDDRDGGLLGGLLGGRDRRPGAEKSRNERDCAEKAWRRQGVLLQSAWGIAYWGYGLDHGQYRRV